MFVRNKNKERVLYIYEFMFVELLFILSRDLVI